VPFNPNNIRWNEWGAALLAIAGPLTNLMLAFLIYGLSVLIGKPVNLSGAVNGLDGLILTVGVMVNLGFFIFNLIPILLLMALGFYMLLAPEFVRRGMESMERYGIIIVFALILIALVII
jgi:Zn-dependent protease